MGATEDFLAELQKRRALQMQKIQQAMQAMPGTVASGPMSGGKQPGGIADIQSLVGGAGMLGSGLGALAGSGALGGAAAGAVGGSAAAGASGGIGSLLSLLALL
jgi:hypothetical protein